MFEKATRQKLRFPSSKGFLSVEDLWDLPLQSKSGFDLDSVARAVNATLKQTQEESFVTPVLTQPAKDAELQMAVVKHIIAVRLAENADAVQAVKRKQEREVLLGILDRKQNAALEALSPEEIQARLAALG